MDSLEYSKEALEAKSLFYSKKSILFVEGIDDPLFWEEFTNKLNLEVHIEDVGGSEEIEKIIDKIINENAKIYVARDRDYLDFYNEEAKRRYNHNRILLTYGHSIENTLFNPIIINDVIKSYVKTTNFNELAEINSLYSSLEKEITELLVLDILTSKHNTSTKVLGDSCMRYLKNSKSVQLCSEKITNFINSLGLRFRKNQITEIKSIFNFINKRIISLIKGHFLTSFIINIVKYFVKKYRNKEVTINKDNLYSSLINRLSIIEKLPEYKYYLKECRKINYA